MNGMKLIAIGVVTLIVALLIAVMVLLLSRWQLPAPQVPIALYKAQKGLVLLCNGNK